MGRVFLCVLIMLSLLSPLAAASERTVILQPDGAEGADAWIANIAPYRATGVEDSLIVGFTDGSQPGEIEEIPIQISAGQNDWRALLRFTLPEFPGDATILSAELSLYAKNVWTVDDPYTTPMRIGARPARNEWIEGTAERFSGVNWFYRFLPFLWNQTGGDFGAVVDDAPIDGSPGWISWSVPELVEEWIAEPDSNLGVFLKRGSGSAAIVSFAASEHADETLRPRLTIVYESAEGDTFPAVEDGTAEIQPKRISPGSTAEMTAYAALRFGGQGIDTGVNRLFLPLPEGYASPAPSEILWNGGAVGWSDASGVDTLAVALDEPVAEDGLLEVRFTVQAPGVEDPEGARLPVLVDDSRTTSPPNELPEGDADGAPGNGDDCLVTVLPGEAIRLRIDPKDPIVDADSSLLFTAIGEDETGYLFPIDPDWRIEGDVGAIDGSGLFDPAKEGTGEVIAEAGAAAGSTSVSVTHGAMAALLVSPADTAIAVDDMVHYRAYALDGDGNPWAVTAKWSVEPEIGSISLTGVFLPAAPGEAIVIGLASGFRDTATVTVAPSLPSRIEIDPPEADATTDTTILFTARVFDSGGAEIDTTPVWRVSGGIGSIDPSGFFDAAAPGEGWVVASVGPASDSARIDLSVGRLDSLAALPADTVLTADESLLLAAVGWDADRNPFDPGAAWSEPTGLGAVDGEGLFHPRETGEALLVASASGLADTARVLIVPGALASLDVVPFTATLHTEQSLDFTAVARDGDGNVIDDPGDPVWSGASRIGSLDPSTGHFEPDRPGTDTARVALGAVTGESGPITVTAGPTRSLILDPSSLTVFAGEEISFTAHTYDGEGNPTTGPIAWTVIGGVGSVDGVGLFRAESAGEGAVAASAGSAADTAAVTVFDDLGLVVDAVLESRERATRGESGLPVALAVTNRTGDTLLDLEGALAFASGGEDRSGDYTVTPIPFDGPLADGESDTLLFLVDVAENAVAGIPIAVDGSASAALAAGGDAVAALHASAVGGWTVTGPPVLVDLAGTLRPNRAVAGNDAAFSVALRNDGAASLLLRSGTRFTFTDGAASYEAFLSADLSLEGDGGSGIALFDPSGIPAGFDPGDYEILFQTDGVDGNGAPFDKLVSASANLLLLLPPYVEATAPPLEGVVVHPGAKNVPLLRVDLANLYLSEKNLSSIRLADSGAGAGSIAARDLLWDRIVLREDADRDGAADPTDPVLGEGTLSGGALLLDGLELAVPAGDTVSLLVTGNLSLLQAPDGEELDLAVEGASDLVFAEGATPAGAFPLDSPGAHFVDGLVAGQLDPRGDFPPSLPAGSEDSLVLSIRIPSNGYAVDELRALTVRNLGDAEAGTDLAGLRIWRDGGNGFYDRGEEDDTDLGALYWIGDGWSRSGLAQQVPAGGFRLFVSASVTDNPVDGRTVLLGVPMDGVILASANDGPVDTTALCPELRVLGGAERVVLTDPERGSGGPVLPGEENREMLSFRLSNVYADTVRLERLFVANRSGGPNPDEATPRVYLFGPSGAGKDVSPAFDPIASAPFLDGVAELEGFTALIPPGEDPLFRLSVDVGLLCASDGDTVRIAIESAAAFGFLGERSLSGAFPLLSAEPVVDGMAAAQIRVLPAGGGAIAPFETGCLAFSFVVPPNGCRPDTLEGVRIARQGTADAVDISRLVLSGGAADEVIGELVWNGSVWAREGIGLPVEAPGETLRVRVDASADAREGRTVLLALPENGLTLRSGNDGPVDDPVPSASLFYISTSPVFADIRFSADRASVGQTLEVEMAVENVTAQDPRIFLDVEPVGFAPLGPEAIILSGPSPASVESLAAGGEALFTWTVRAESTGSAWFSGEARAVETGGDTVRALPTISPTLTVEAVPSGVTVQATATLPGSVARGETGVSLFLLTLSHDDGASSDAAPIRIDTVRVALAGETGAPLDPALLLDALSAERSGRPIGRVEAPEFGAAEAAIPLDEPILLEPGDEATLGLSIDLHGDPGAAALRAILAGAGSLAARDANSNAPVPVGGGFPFATGLAEVVIPPDSLVVEVTEGPPPRVNRGARSARILRCVVESRGVTGVTADVVLSAIHIGLSDGLFPYESARITGPGITHFDGDGWIVRDGEAVFSLDPQLTVPPNNPIEILIAGDVDSFAPLGPFRLGVAESTFVDPKPAADGGTVEVVLRLTGPMESEVSVRTDSIAALVETPPDSSVARPGDRDREVLHIHFIHEGDSTRAAVRLDGVRIRLENEAGDSTEIRSLVERLRVREGDRSLASAAPVQEGAASLALPFSETLTVEPGGSALIRVQADLKADAPPGGYRFVLPATAVAAADENESTPVAVHFLGDDPTAARSPLLSVRKTSDRVETWIDLTLPAVAIPGALVAGAGSLRLLPSGGEETAAAHLAEFSLRFEGPGGSTIAPAEAVRGASSGPAKGAEPVEAILAPDRLRFLFDPALTLAPAETLTLAIDLETAESPTVSSFRVRLPLEEILLEEQGPLVDRANGDGGANPSSWTHLAEKGFRESLRSYPNPFTPADGAAVFAFYAGAAGRASIRIYTGLGAPVRTLEKRVTEAGLVEIEWDGRNGKGDRVLSGGYLASVEIVYDGGGRDHAIHKIAVLN